MTCRIPFYSLSEFFRWGLMRIYFGCDFLDCCLHLYCDKLKYNFLLTVSSSLPQMFFCLSEKTNNSNWEIILKVWLLIKWGVWELWRSYLNNDIIVFHTYQSEKHHKKFNFILTALHCGMSWTCLVVLWILCLYCHFCSFLITRSDIVLISMYWIEIIF